MLHRADVHQPLIDYEELYGSASLLVGVDVEVVGKVSHFLFSARSECSRHRFLTEVVGEEFGDGVADGEPHMRFVYLRISVFQCKHLQNFVDFLRRNAYSIVFNLDFNFIGSHLIDIDDYY